MLLGLKRHSCPGGALACDTPRETFWRMLPPRRRALSPNRISGGTHRAGPPHVQAGSCCLHAAHCCTGAAETPPEHCPVAVHLCRKFPSWGTPAEDHAAPVCTAEQILWICPFAFHRCSLCCAPMQAGPLVWVWPAGIAQASLCTAQQPVQPWACNPVMHHMTSSSLKYHLHCSVGKLFSYGLAYR